jgi:hypothetical protein
MRRALLVGINYTGTPNRLFGCINDINNIGSYLYTSRKYNSFIVMTDNTSIKPTCSNILDGFRALLKGAVAGDELWFHYSGHGSLVRDTNGDEESRMDSCICPLDFMRSGFISDDIIRNNLADLVPKGVRLYMVLDACHSGTCCDLRYKYDDSSYLTNTKARSPEKYVPSDWSLKQTSYEFKRYNKTNGEVFCISGCQDNQTSADAFMDGKAAGALTYILLTCLRNNSQTNYKWKHLLKDVCCSEKVQQFTQQTALTSGNPLNLEDNIFITPIPVSVSVSVPATVKPSQNITTTGKKSISVISLSRNLNYNPKIKKLFIKYH